LILKQLYKENRLNKSIFNFNGIEFNCFNIDNTYNNHLECSFGLTLLLDCQNEYFQGYNSVSINNWKTLKPHLRKIIGDKVHIYYHLNKSADFVLNIELLNLEDCEYDAYIMSKSIKYSNFNEPFNLIENSQAKIVIETSIDNVDDFENLNVCMKMVYTDQTNRKTLAHMN
jgi:hypothetical protein